MSKNEVKAVEVAEVKAVDPKAQAKKDARSAAKARVVAFLNDNVEQLGALKADIELFIGKGQRATKTGIRNVNSELRDAFIEKGSLTEMDLFMKFRIGRPEMVGKIRILTLTPNPADRVWVKFNEATETYHVMGQGTNPPTGWTGYIPASKVQGL